MRTERKEPGGFGRLRALSFVSRIVLTMICCLPPVAIYAPKGLVPLSVVTALALLCDRGIRADVRREPAPLMVWAFLPLLVWALVSVAWTPVPGRGIRLLASLVGLMVVARILVAGARAIPAGERTTLTSALVASGAAFVTLLAIENFSAGFIIEILKSHKGKGVDDHTTYITPGNSVLAVFIWPIVFAVARRTSSYGGMAALAVVCVVLFYGPSAAPTLSLLASTVFFLAAFFGGKRALSAISVVLIAAAFLSPFVIPFLKQWATGADLFSLLGVSGSHRWAIWQFVSERILDHPIIGWGIDSSRAIPGRNALVFGEYGEILPLHPHNAFLQIWLELGLVGVIALAVILALIPVAARKAAGDALQVAIAFAFFMSYLVLGQLSFGIWQNWWLATGCIALSLSLIPGPRGRDDQA